MENTELLTAIQTIVNNAIEPLKADMASIKSDVSVLKTDVAGLKSDVTTLKSEVSEIKVQVTRIEERVTKIEVSQENVTNKHLKLLSEGHQLVIDNSKKSNERINQLDEKVEDIQITVEVLKYITVNKK